jgi:hypothetical protein
MTAYKAPLDDLRFALFDVLGAEPILTALQGGEGHSRDLLDAVLEEAGRLSEQLLAPTNAPADAEGCHFDKATHAVTTPKSFKESFRQFADARRCPACWAPPPPRSSSPATWPGACIRCSPKAPPTRWNSTAKNGSASFT